VPVWGACVETERVTEYAPLTATRSGLLRHDRPSTDAGGGGHRLDTAREWLQSGGSVLLFGPVGVGKSAALDALAAAAGDARVLRCAPGAADADRAYRGLAQLLSSVSESELRLLPAARRRVLGGLLHYAVLSTRGPAPALSRRARWSTRATSSAVQLATWNLLRVLVASRPLLLVVDNINWLDRPSADVLRFVASRVGDQAIQMVAAEQVPADRVPLARHQCPGPLLMTRPDPLPATGAPDSHGRRRQGGKGAPWAACRRSPESLA
jgi:hypothetical protein